MRNRPWNRRALGAAVVVAAAVLTALTACGGSGSGSEQASPPAASESSYCKTIRRWQVHELTPIDESDAAAVERYWNEFMVFQETSLLRAPAAIRPQQVVNTRAYRTRFTPVLEKYGFDFGRIDSEGSPAEKAILGEPPPDVADAQAGIHAYEARVCGTDSPPPANVTFKPNASAARYCSAAAAQEHGLEKVAASGFDAAAFRAYATSDRFLKALDDQEAAAPAEIAADVKADNDWVRNHKLKVLERFDYDLRRLLLEGSADDRAVFNYWDPAIVRQDRRVEAYVQQVCGGG